MLIDINEMAKSLSLSVLVETKTPKRFFKSADQNRPGLQFSGFFEFFANERMQIIGRVEMTYLKTLEASVRKARLEEFFSREIPCIVICRDMECPEDLAQLAREKDVPVLGSKEHTTRFQAQALGYLNRMLAPHQTIHGVLVDVYGVGVLLTGESGVGKSEAALELIKRGHQLVADDVVDLMRVSETRLIGEAPEMVRHYMEIRGIGIIDVSVMFGVASVIPSKSIDIVMHLENWVQNRDYDRLGLNEEYTEMLGVRVPQILMPVRPGRNLAVVIEVAARNWRLHRMGFNAAEALNNRLMEMASKKASE